MFFNFITENLLEQIITETSNRSGIFLNMCFKKIFLFEMLSSHSSYIDVNANIQNDVINYFILINKDCLFLFCDSRLASSILI
jgi:hypothetical protein